jgi:enterochelin esterase-like enzyme
MDSFFLRERFWSIVISLILAVGIAACSSGYQVSQNSPTVQLQELSSASLSTDPTLIPSETASPLPVFTPSINPSPSPTPKLTQSSTPTPLTCWREGGRFEKGQVSTELLRLPLEFSVYLPPCYDQLPDSEYPVLYLIHGQSFDDTQWDKLGVDEKADELIAEGEILPLIMVMPRDRLWTQPTEDLFGEAVIEVLIPWIDENYRTKTEREFRAIGGLSRGAGWALHLGFSRWEFFGAVGLHSLPVFWTDLKDIRKWLDSIPPELLPRIYMDLGDRDRSQISKSAIWFEELLTEMRIPHEWHLYPGYHEESYWESHIEEYIRWYVQDWKLEQSVEDSP